MIFEIFGASALRYQIENTLNGLFVYTQKNEHYDKSFYFFGVTSAQVILGKNQHRLQD